MVLYDDRASIARMVRDRAKQYGEMHGKNYETLITSLADDIEAAIDVEDHPAARRLTLNDIIDCVGTLTGLDGVDIASQARAKQFVRARHAVIYLANRLLALSLNQIGARLGGRDHTSISYALLRAYGRVHDELPFAQLIQAAEERLLATPVDPRLTADS